MKTKTYECSSIGDKRFSAFYAKLKKYDNQTIEKLYQVDIKGYATWSEAYGKKGKLYDYETQKAKYEELWIDYLNENPELLDELLEITETHILNDAFAKVNSVNQADTLMSITAKIKEGELKMARKSMNEAPDLGEGKERLGIGEHVVEITKVEAGTTSSGLPKVDLTLETEDGIAWDKLILTEKAIGFIKRYLSAAGYDIDDIEYEENEKGKKKDQITCFYMPNDDGEEEEWDLEQLLLEETVCITLVEGDKSYKDPTTGDTVLKDKPGVKVKSVDEAE